MPIQITANEYEANPGEVVNSVKVKPDSFRMMIMTSPRTGNNFAGLFMELDVDLSEDGMMREVWVLATPAQGGKIMKRAEPWQRKAYLAELEKEGKPKESNNTLREEGVESI
jgi:hypothetical protein